MVLALGLMVDGLEFWDFGVGYLGFWDYGLAFWVYV